jgi:SAM-dependent methyltransferase/predicted O-methyltransferase YrrM
MTAPTAPPADRPQGLARVRTLWGLFRNEREEPEPFYRMLADELAADLDRRHGPLAGQRLVDAGCGPGWYAEALRRRGATVVPLDGAAEELTSAGRAPDGSLVADATNLPFAGALFDGVVCSNLLEHTPDTKAVLEEIRRVLKPGGWAYVSWTNWFSPWGGHDMTPWHLLGPRLGPRLYERRHGPPRKNRFGEGLFPVHIGPTLRLVDELDGMALEVAEPRYWPWARAIMHVPGVREVASWNCVLRLRRLEQAETGGSDIGFRAVEATIADVEGWLAPSQARRLWDRAQELRAGASVVEIGSYRGRSAIVLAAGAPSDASVLAIDPHAGNDRGPQQWEGTPEEGQSDHEVFLRNLAEAGVADRVRHVRKYSHEALDDVDAPIDLLYVDGAHGYGPARDDLVQWSAKLAPGATMLVHDSFSSVGVTLALMTTTFFGRELRYVGRSRSMTEYRREPVEGVDRLRNAARQAAELPWFARNVVIKALIVARLRPLSRLLGHTDGTWPY